MNISGNLKDYSLPKLLIDLNRNRQTGTLSVTLASATRKVYLEKGNAIFASSTHPDERLGEMLIKSGKITIDQYKKSVEILKQTGKRQGAILVELGYLTPQDLVWGVKYQVKEIIYALFELEEGEFSFEDGAVPAEEVITVQMSMGNVMYEGIKRIDNLTMIMREMPDMKFVIRLSSDPMSLFQNIVLGPRDKKMLAEVDGVKTVEELVNASTAGSFETMKTLYVLLSTGIVEAGEGAAETHVPEAEDMFSLDDLLKCAGGEEEELAARVDSLHGKLDTLAEHEILELGPDADIESLRTNYYRLVREFHPDRYLTCDDQSLVDKVIEIVNRINQAYALLKDDGKRKAYFDSLRQSRAPRPPVSKPTPKPAREPMPEPELVAEIIEEEPAAAKTSEPTVVTLSDADFYIAQGMYTEAMDVYRRVLAAEPDNRAVLQRQEELKALMKLLGK
jgi:DnaJ-domain-containing protein 1